MPARKHDDGSVPPLGLPRNLLVPYVLLFLKNWSAHGYQIMQTLTMLGFATVDPATVYRTLRQMEREGLVLSSWETSDAGPARRTYRITESGEQFLSQWADALGTYQRFLDRFFELYAGTGATAPPATDAAESTGGDGASGPRTSGRTA
ncbi:MAG: helix-turn-helix transcriptional regulator [Dehalococcoidia bacterium]